MLGYVTRRVKRIRQRLFAKPAPPPTNVRVRCREITSDDFDGVIDLLTRGFWRTPRSFWVDAFRRLSAHPTPEGFSKYGYLLDNDGTPVGVILMITTTRVINGVSSIWCGGSSYYVDPEFRLYAPLLTSRAHRFKDVTYFDLTPSPPRLPVLKAHKYKKLAEGIHVAFPALCRSPPDARVYKVTDDSYMDDRLPAYERDLLVDHASYGCLSVVCEHRGTVHPFVFAIRRKYGVPYGYLIYCRNQADFISFAGTLGRFLVKRGLSVVVLDADGPIAGIPGRHIQALHRYWKGQQKPPLGDLAYTEIAMFGVI